GPMPPDAPGPRGFWGTLRPVRWSFLWAAFWALPLSLTPLLALPGAESSLFAALLLAPVAGWAAVQIARPDAAPGADAARALMHVATFVVLLNLALFAPLLVNGLRLRWCDPQGALSFVVLGPLCACALAALVGLVLVRLRPQGRAAGAGALAVPLLTFLWALYRFYAGPSIALYGHFFGFFPGTFYDARLTLSPAYLLFRLESCGWGLSLAAFWWATARACTRRVRLVWLVLGLMGLALGLTLRLQAEPLGTASSRAHLARHLSSVAAGRYCRVHAPPGVGVSELVRWRRDCDFRVLQMHQHLGLPVKRRVTAFMFRDAAQKKALMGAGQTLIAKPWRRAVYLQRAGWPHPVLAHEVAHVVLGEVAPGPFRVAGRLGGWLPEAALIEGAAVALAWTPRQGLTPHQWAGHLAARGQLPPLAALSGLRFVLQPAAQAYTVMGSFLRYLWQHAGRAAFIQVYRAGDLTVLGQRRLQRLEAQWRRFLKAQSLPPAAAALGEQRFSRPSNFRAPCPHQVAELRHRTGRALRRQAWHEAGRLCAQIEAVLPGDPEATALQLWLQAKRGDVVAASTRARRLTAARRLPRAVAAQSFVRLADAAWRAGKRSVARQLLKDLQRWPLPIDLERNVAVRRLALQAPAPERLLLRRYFTQEFESTASAVAALHWSHLLDKRRQDGLGVYLTARQLYMQQHYHMAEVALQRALGRGLPHPLLCRETRRMLAVGTFAAGHYAQSAQHWRILQTFDPDDVALQTQVADWLARIRAHRRGRIR
ncbi:MAG: hypothetical protein ACPGUV_02830, partial [Polyangiales bacterium]